MDKLTRDSLYSLEKYAEARTEFRDKVMRHKKNRQVAIGPNATLYFEDRLTILYQVQEMLRVERIFEAAGIEEELESYNPLIPDGDNWKATFMLEYSNPDERQIALTRLIGIENKVWVKVEGFDQVNAIADEDLERQNAEKTSSVHFLRFQLSPDMCAAAKKGAAISMGIDHVNYIHRIDNIAAAVRDSLVADLQ